MMISTKNFNFRLNPVVVIILIWIVVYLCGFTTSNPFESSDSLFEYVIHATPTAMDTITSMIRRGG